MHKEKKGKNFIKKPYYEGGTKAMRAFIKQHIKYPKEAINDQIEGTVVVKYSVDHQGKVTEAKVISGLGYGCDEEALRLTKLLKFKAPKSRGVKVLFHKDIHIHFRLPKQQQTTVNFVYQKESKEKTTEINKSGSYNYTINIP